MLLQISANYSAALGSSVVAGASLDAVAFSVAVVAAANTDETKSKDATSAMILFIINLLN